MSYIQAGGNFVATGSFIGDTAGGGSGPPPYVAKAVQADGNVTVATVGNLVATGDNTGYASHSFWYKWAPPIGGVQQYGSGQFFAVDPQATYTSQMDGDQRSDGGSTPQPQFWDAPSVLFCQDTSLTTTDDGNWHHILTSVQTDFASTSKIMQIYIDDVDAFNPTVGPTGFYVSDPAFIMQWNGLPLWFFNDGNQLPGGAYVGGAADWWLAPGVFMDWSVTANRRMFISAAGKPVNPSGFPPAAVLFSGDASSFADNQGTGGPTTTTTGTLTTIAGPVTAGSP